MIIIHITIGPGFECPKIIEKCNQILINRRWPISRLMPNLEGPTLSKIKSSYSHRLYAALVWRSASLVFPNCKELLLGPQRAIALTVVSEYRTVIHLIARIRCVRLGDS